MKARPFARAERQLGSLEASFWGMLICSARAERRILLRADFRSRALERKNRSDSSSAREPHHWFNYIYNRRQIMMYVCIHPCEKPAFQEPFANLATTSWWERDYYVLPMSAQRMSVRILVASLSASISCFRRATFSS